MPWHSDPLNSCLYIHTCHTHKCQFGCDLKCVYLGCTCKSNFFYTLITTVRFCTGFWHELFLCDPLSSLHSQHHIDIHYTLLLPLLLLTVWPCCLWYTILFILLALHSHSKHWTSSFVSLISLLRFWAYFFLHYCWRCAMDIFLVIH